jgi:hypothetical protein
VKCDQIMLSASVSAFKRLRQVVAVLVALNGQRLGSRPKHMKVMRPCRNPDCMQIGRYICRQLCNRSISRPKNRHEKCTLPRYQTPDTRLRSEDQHSCTSTHTQISMHIPRRCP